ncbi:hypothetical protein BD779DRAFT_898264 [Infundibulicybe gibba]|nr:hypothetical protein BD779DRAFT_898264 [Infundibulicybe gibba]
MCTPRRAAAWYIGRRRTRAGERILPRRDVVPGRHVTRPAIFRRCRCEAGSWATDVPCRESPGASERGEGADGEVYEEGGGVRGKEAAESLLRMAASPRKRSRDDSESDESDYDSEDEDGATPPKKQRTLENGSLTLQYPGSPLSDRGSPPLPVLNLADAEFTQGGSESDSSSPADANPGHGSLRPARTLPTPLQHPPLLTLPPTIPAWMGNNTWP